MKKIFYCLVLLCFFLNAKADHITGGEMYYTFRGVSNGLYQYSVTLKFFKRCESNRQLNDPTIISIFDKSTNSRVSDVSVALARTETLRLTNPDRCITDPPVVCYDVGYYEFDVSLPGSPYGYIITGQVVYRVSGIKNLINYGNIGATYTAEIPGTAVTNGPQNSSAKFVGSDLVVICAGNSFSYSFAAVDNNSDDLRYSFSHAYQGGSGGNANNTPPESPPYETVPYLSVFSGSSPLGNKVNIDPNTGLITGTAPTEAGFYVLTVNVEEVRNGVVIAIQRKDIQVNIAPCTIAGAKLKSEYVLCRDTRSIALSNLSTSPLIVTQQWELFNDKGISLFSSTNATVSYSFPDTGIYTVKLVVNRGRECSDSATSIARVYPGFIPDFVSSGICRKKPTTFSDASTSVYGQVNSWNWKFGEDDIAVSSSNEKNPFFTYAATGLKTIRLIAGNTVGCIDTIFKTITIVDKPPLTLAFRDTLICVKDEVRLEAKGSGKFSWTPTVNIRNPNTFAPEVSPPSTTTYFIDLDDNGCLNTDSVKVRVTDHVSLQAMNDTTVCQGDIIPLKIVSDGFRYFWSPALQIDDPTKKNPIAKTNFATTYEVTAAIGGCNAKDQILINTVPYPSADAGPDTTICFNTSAQLKAGIDGKSFAWLPSVSLKNVNSLTPIASPIRTTSYILYAYDTRGCPKAGTDTIVVNVLPKIHAFAGRDTSVVIGQSLQLEAKEGRRYIWSPVIGLSDPNIARPVAMYNQHYASLRYKVLVYNEAHCVDSAFVNVKVFKSLPAVFVPNAFTPNSDGNNDLLKPVSAGMQHIEYFKVYNRWGQLVFTTSANEGGWDGRIGGKLQDSGTFVWMVKAIDYRGKAFYKNGSVILIR